MPPLPPTSYATFQYPSYTLLDPSLSLCLPLSVLVLSVAAFLPLPPPPVILSHVLPSAPLKCVCLSLSPSSPFLFLFLSFCLFFSTPCFYSLSTSPSPFISPSSPLSVHQFSCLTVYPPVSYSTSVCLSFRSSSI